MGHVASEVWSNRLNKWVFVDPQFGIYVKYKGKFLSFYDMFQLKGDGKFNQIEFIPTKGYLKYHSVTKKKVVAGYKSFIRNYFGYVDTGYKIDEETKVSLTLPLEGESQFLTFQGMSRNKTIFTNKVDDIYYSLN